MSLIYSNNEMDELANSMVHHFLGSSQNVATCVDIEQFIKKYLRLPIQYWPFAEDDQDKIGFISDGVTPLCIWYRHQKIRHVFPKGTIVLDRFLLRPEESNRRRFTLAHEAGHYILDQAVVIASFHREYDCGAEYSSSAFHALFDIRETQVDRFAAALLMPVFLVKSLYGQIFGNRKIPVYGSCILCLRDKLLMHHMSSELGVSYTACFIRLKELGFLEPRDISEYLASEIGLEDCDGLDS